MNEVVDAIMKHEFKDKKRMDGLKHIARRSKNTRIQNKTFKTLLLTFMKERPVAILGEVVLIKNEYYLTLKELIDTKEAELNGKADCKHPSIQ